MISNDFGEQIEDIRRGYEDVKQRITLAAERVGRDPDAIKIVAVTKQMPVEVIQAGIRAGIRVFGENYPEQAAEKIRQIGDQADIEWHMIGHIQSRKTDIVCEYFHMVHSLDRLKIANYLNRYSGEVGRVMPVLFEVNLSGERSKYGWKVWEENDWEEILPAFRRISNLPNLTVQGLMSMPPLYEDPEVTRPIYRRLRKLQEFLRSEIPDVRWDELSIGTSFDFEVAVEEGATIVRIGTEIFGSRPS